MRKQSASHLIMVRPAAFGYDPETAPSNRFQKKPDLSSTELQNRALQQFNEAVKVLRAHGLCIHILEDTPYPPKPNAIFPNNWFSTHVDGSLVLYPMATASRRTERALPLSELLESQGFTLKRRLDFSHYEQNHQYLEGTGSLVLDRVNRKAYACRSERTHPGLVAEFCRQMGYEPICFGAEDVHGQAIYHSNVLLAIGSGYAVLCAESLLIPEDLERVRRSLKQDSLEVIEISQKQMSSFAGNMLEVENRKGKKSLLISETALKALRTEQLNVFELYAQPLPIAVDVIEKAGGGSIRCMIAECFLEKMEQ